MVETVGAVLAVFLDAHMGAFADFVEVRSLVTNERNSRKNFAVAFCKYNAVCIFLESPFADADVFLVCKELENFVRVVTQRMSRTTKSFFIGNTLLIEICFK